MRTQTIDQIVNEILTGMSMRKRDTPITADTSGVPDFEDAFEKFLQDEDQTSKAVMRRIWDELQTTAGKES